MLINLENHTLNYIDLVITGNLLPEHLEQLRNNMHNVAKEARHET